MTSQSERPLKSVRLWIYALAVVFVALGCFSLLLNSKQQIAKPPNAWEAYSEKRVQDNLSSGRVVLLYCRPTYHPATSVIDDVFLDEQIAHLLDEADFELMQHSYRDWQGETLRQLFERHGHTKYPMIFIYYPNGQVASLSTSLTAEAMRIDLEDSLARHVD